jgi:hypothetical protein
VAPPAHFLVHLIKATPRKKKKHYIAALKSDPKLHENNDVLISLYSAYPVLAATLRLEREYHQRPRGWIHSGNHADTAGMQVYVTASVQISSQ